MLIERVNIISNEEVAHNIWQMCFEAPEIISEYKGPGQFINILVEDSWSHPLRRPMSIASAKNGKISIIYKIFGDVTNILSKKLPNDNIEILGPLGNTFTNWNVDCYPILVGGGVGIPPLLNLKSECENYNIDHSIVIGARNATEHFMTHQPENDIILTTDDGSFGELGTVMNPIDRIIKEKNSPYRKDCLHFFIYNTLPGTTSAAGKKAYFLKDIILGSVQEVINLIAPILETRKLKDDHLVALLQYLDLSNEIVTV